MTARLVSLLVLALTLAPAPIVAPSLTVAPVAAQPRMVLPTATSPESVGLSRERLGRIDAVTREHIESGIVPGAVILIARGGQVAHHVALGFRDRAAGQAMTPDALFRIYSMTKPITSVAVMMLVEEGKLQIYDPVGKYLPELAKMKVAVEKTDASGAKTVELVEPRRQMTVQDLLRHTSGLTYGSRSEGSVGGLYRAAKVGSRDDSAAAMVTKLGAIPLVHAPGTRFEYSVSTDVLGRLVEVVSGKSLGDFFEERIFRPLGMRDSFFQVPADKAERLAQPWQRPGGPAMTPRFDPVAPARFQSGGGGLVSTAADYLAFATMLLNGGELGGHRILGRKTIEFMTSDHLGAIPVDTPGLGFGLGFQVRRDAGIAGLPGSVGEYGWAGNAGTLFWVDPREKLIAIYMVQVSDFDRVALRNQFRTLVESTIVDAPGR
jgi:CubicO group peptidase (beta-lactamase class C family)